MAGENSYGTQTSIYIPITWGEALSAMAARLKPLPAGGYSVTCSRGCRIDMPCRNISIASRAVPQRHADLPYGAPLRRFRVLPACWNSLWRIESHVARVSAAIG